MAHLLVLNFPVAFPEDVPKLDHFGLREIAETRIRAAIMIAECGATHEGIAPLLQDALDLQLAADARLLREEISFDPTPMQSRKAIENALQDMIAEMETLDELELATLNDAVLSLRNGMRPMTTPVEISSASSKAKRSKKAAA